MTNTYACISAALCLLSILSVSSSAEPDYEPAFGFVSVPGELGSDDTGVDPRILGNALRHSSATCIRAGIEEIDSLELGSRLGIGYIWGGVSESIIRSYNRAGYYHFIFENEPDGTGAANPNWAPQYMDRLKRTYLLIKAIDPSNKMISGNLLNPKFDLMYSLGFKDVSDVIGYHNYSNDPRTGINMAALPPVRKQMEEAGDGAKQIFLGEGWGPARELPGLKRLFPDSPVTPAEIRMLRDFVVNGYRSIVTPTHDYDPEWLLGVLFFTLNDNWGGQAWAGRAQPRYDESGKVTTYFVDGYDVGLDIFPHFYNGGLLDINGNAKDNLMDVFPGRGLALANSGFEYVEPGESRAAAEWIPSSSGSALSVDSSIRRNGRRSQRLDLSGPSLSLHQDSLHGSVSGGGRYSASVWVKCFQVEGAGARLEMCFLAPDGRVLGKDHASRAVAGSTVWTRLSVEAAVPPDADRLRIRLVAKGKSGIVWFDDAIASLAAGSAKGRIDGYVLDERREPVPGAVVSTTSGGFVGMADSEGFFSIEGVTPGVYDVIASRSGYSRCEATAQLVLPGKTRPMGFTLPKSDPLEATGVRVRDAGTGGTLEVSFAPPSSEYDSVRVYRSDDPGQLGQLAGETMESPLWDTGARDGTRYSYTLRAVRAGIESQNNAHAYGIPSAGILSTVYSVYSEAQWGHFGDGYGQTFIASDTGSISSASAMPGFGPGPSGTELTFAILEGGPDGRQIGPARTASAAGNAETSVTWLPGEVQVVRGKRYCLKLTGSRGFAAYRGRDSYEGGCFYIDGESVPESDMWGTVKIVRPKPVDIENVRVRPSQGSGVTATWQTSALSSSAVEVWDAARNRLVVRKSLDGLTTDHEVVIEDIGPGRLYWLRVRSTADGAPEALSPYYPLQAD